MKSTYKLLLIGVVIIGLLDVLGSIASKQLDFNYSKLASFSLIVYCGAGFIFSRKTNLKTAIFLTAALGFFDSTIGWKISMLLGAKTGMAERDPEPLIWAVTIVFMIAYGAFCGFIGGGLHHLSKRVTKL